MKFYEENTNKIIIIRLIGGDKQIEHAYYQIKRQISSDVKLNEEVEKIIKEAKKIEEAMYYYLSLIHI